MALHNKKVAILIAPRGTEESEFIEPKKALEEAGAKVVAVSFEKGDGQTVNGDLALGGQYVINETFDTADAADFDGLVIPGGTVGADRLRGNAGAVGFVRKFFEQKKPVGAICHGPWLLVEADVLQGRTITSFPTLKTDVENAGGHWTDREVVVDQGLVTSRNPNDLPAFCSKVVEEIGEGPHDAQARSA